MGLSGWIYGGVIGHVLQEREKELAELIKEAKSLAKGNGKQEIDKAVQEAGAKAKAAADKVKANKGK